MCVFLVWFLIFLPSWPQIVTHTLYNESVRRRRDRRLLVNYTVVVAESPVHSILSYAGYVIFWRGGGEGYWWRETYIIYYIIATAKSKQRGAPRVTQVHEYRVYVLYLYNGYNMYCMLLCVCLVQLF